MSDCERCPLMLDVHFEEVYERCPLIGGEVHLEEVY